MLRAHFLQNLQYVHFVLSIVQDTTNRVEIALRKSTLTQKGTEQRSCVFKNNCLKVFPNISSSPKQLPIYTEVAQD